MNTNTKNTIKLNEVQLRKMIAESVKKVLEETTAGQFDGVGADYDGRYTDSTGFSYIRSSINDIENIRTLLQLVVEHIEKLCTKMDDEEYAFGRMDANSTTTDILREMYPLVKRLGRIWGLEHY